MDDSTDVHYQFGCISEIYSTLVVYSPANNTIRDTIRDTNFLL